MKIRLIGVIQFELFKNLTHSLAVKRIHIVGTTLVQVYGKRKFFIHNLTINVHKLE